MNVFELEASLKLDTKAYEKSLDSAEKDSKDFNKALEKMEDTAEDAADSISDAFGDMSDAAEEAADDTQSAIDSIDISIDPSDAVSALDDISDAANSTGDQVSGSVDNMNESLGGVGDAAQGALDQFAPAIGGMVSAIATGGIVAAIGAVVSAVNEIGQAAMENDTMFQEAMANIATGTGIVGEQLDELSGQASTTWSTFSDADLTLDETSNLMATMGTRFGLTAEELSTTWSSYSEDVLRFAQVTNTDASDAVNGIMDMMKQWGMVTGDTGTDMQTMIGIMDQLTVAQEGCDANLGTLTDGLTAQAGAFQELGISYSDGLAMMVAYEDAGGDATTLTTGMYQALKNLNGATDDVPAAFAEVIDVLEHANSVTDALNFEILDTGETVEDIFGERNAQKIANTFVNGAADCDKFSDSINNATGEVDKLYPEVVTTEDKMSIFGRTMQTVANDMTGGYGIIGAINNLTGATNSALDVYSAMVDYINSHPVNAQINVNSSTSSSTSTGHATAMHRAELFTRPTFFTASDYAGESGNEILSGEQHLQSTVQSAVSSAINGVMGNIYTLLAQYLPSCASNKDVYLDGKKVAAGIYDKVSDRIDASAKFANYIKGVR